jgi:hypothetical protein
MTIKMFAKYPGKCSVCGQRFAAGTEITWDSETRKTAHILCPAAAGDPWYNGNIAPKTAVPKATATAPKADDEVKMYFVSHNRNGGPAIGTALKAKDGKIVTVVRKTARFVNQDEVDDMDDFSNGGRPYWSVTAYCRLATEDEAAPVLAAIAKAEEVKIAKKRVQEIKDMFVKSEFLAPKIPGGYILDGERLIDTATVYGGGDWFVIEDDSIWFVRNNGGDGDCWDLNNVRTGGAGGIGWKLPMDEALVAELRKLDALLKK